MAGKPEQASPRTDTHLHHLGQASTVSHLTEEKQSRIFVKSVKRIIFSPSIHKYSEMASPLAAWSWLDLTWNCIPPENQ